MKKYIAVILPVILIAFISSCQSGASTEELVLAYPDYEVLTDEVLYKEIKKGTGDEVESGDKVRVHYVGVLENGSQFDSSRKRGEPFEFVVDETSVIDGWQEGIKGMQVGGIRELIISSRKGYGRANDNPRIPPNSTLIFEIELLDIIE